MAIIDRHGHISSGNAMEVSVRDLKDHLSEYLRRARAGSWARMRAVLNRRWMRSRGCAPSRGFVRATGIRLRARSLRSWCPPGPPMNSSTGCVAIDRLSGHLGAAEALSGGGRFARNMRVRPDSGTGVHASDRLRGDAGGAGARGAHGAARGRRAQAPGSRARYGLGCVAHDRRRRSARSARW